MRKTLKLLSRSAVATSVALSAVACSDAASPGITGLPSTTVTLERETLPGGMSYGEVKLCKAVQPDDPGGTFTFSVTVTGVDASTKESTLGPIAIANPTVTLDVPAGGSNCQVVFKSGKGGDGLDKIEIVENGPPANWSLATINTTQIMSGPLYTPVAPGLVDGEDVANRKSTTYSNDDMARIVTFTNDYNAPPPPPPQLCDFITFGRLVVEVGNKKVVISGNAGGNKPGGGIMGEFHIEANGVDNHVANVATYGPIAAGALSGYTNSRIVTGTAKNGNAVELRLWDGGEPGKGTDRVYVKINGTELFGAAGKLIDQGNMQYHPTCRGPKD